MGHYRGRDNRKRRRSRRRRNERVIARGLGRRLADELQMLLPPAFDALARALQRVAAVIQEWFEALAAPPLAAELALDDEAVGPEAALRRSN